MFQLTYISTARPGAFEKLENILESARHRNRIHGVTGLLIADGTRFLQVLEGQYNVVNEIFERIKRDDRHFAIVTLSQHDILDREFGNWDMACNKVGMIRAGRTLSESVDALVDQVSNQNMKALLSGFARIDRGAA